MLACAMTAAAGFVDGIGFIHLGGYFVSFMSGNSTRAGADLAAGDLLGWAKALGLVLAFVFGVMLATWITRGSRIRRIYAVGDQPRAVWLSVGLLALAAACGSLLPAEAAVAPLIAAAMGAVNATFARGGEVSVGLTYMTGALVKAGQHAAAVFTEGWNTAWLRYAALWTAIALGSAAGAATYLLIGLAGIWAAVVVLAAAACLLSGSARRQPR